MLHTNFYLKDGIPESRGRELALLSIGLFPKELQGLVLSEPEVRSFFQISHAGLGSQGLEHLLLLS